MMSKDIKLLDNAFKITDTYVSNLEKLTTDVQNALDSLKQRNPNKSSHVVEIQAEFDKMVKDLHQLDEQAKNLGLQITNESLDKKSGLYKDCISFYDDFNARLKSGDKSTPKSQDQKRWMQKFRDNVLTLDKSLSPNKYPFNKLQATVLSFYENFDIMKDKLQKLQRKFQQHMNSKRKTELSSTVPIPPVQYGQTRAVHIEPQSPTTNENNKNSGIMRGVTPYPLPSPQKEWEAKKINPQLIPSLDKIKNSVNIIAQTNKENILKPSNDKKRPRNIGPVR